MNLYLRILDLELWHWEHRWEEHRHTYERPIVLRLMTALPEPRGWIHITMYTRITLDLSHNNPFAQPHPPPPLEVDAEEMDVDLPDDYIFLEPMEEDSE